MYQILEAKYQQFDCKCKIYYCVFASTPNCSFKKMPWYGVYPTYLETESTNNVYRKFCFFQNRLLKNVQQCQDAVLNKNSLK